jgi:acyl carrier protein
MSERRASQASEPGGSKTDLAERIRAALQNVVPDANLAALDPERNLREQIALDSVEYLRFVLLLGKELGADIPGVDFPRLSSLRGAVDYLHNRLYGTSTQ